MHAFAAWYVPYMALLLIALAMGVAAFSFYAEYDRPGSVRGIVDQTPVWMHGPFAVLFVGGFFCTLGFPWNLVVVNTLLMTLDVLAPPESWATTVAFTLIIVTRVQCMWSLVPQPPRPSLVRRGEG